MVILFKWSFSVAKTNRIPFQSNEESNSFIIAIGKCLSTGVVLETTGNGIVPPALPRTYID
jgi:hypothetical protein